MKRDMNLIRLILLALEGDESADARSKTDYDGKTLAYHASLLKEAGFVEGVIMLDENGDPRAFVLSRMTWSGHDFLDAMRDDSIWNKAQDTILKPIGGLAFDVLMQWLKAQMQVKLGLPTS